MTTRNVIPRLAAVRDVEDAVDHYLGEGAPAAALGLIAALEQAYEHILHHPATGSSRYAEELGIPGLRFFPLAGYPYLVFFVERPGHIDVWRVLHARRDIPARFREPDGA